MTATPDREVIDRFPIHRNKGAMTLEPGLYVAATPIGNLGDVTFRVVETLKAADKILCEDTRRTAKLCAAYGIETRRAAYNEHNADRVEAEILAALKEGAVIALVSDAGTPLISDPGHRLVRAARDAGIKVFPLPGASAVIAALSASGLPAAPFLFAGFPPAKADARRRMFKTLAPIEATLVFYESPVRLGESLAAMAEAFSGRRAVVGRELTKIYEEFDDGSLPSLAQKYRAQPPKGEIVVVVAPPTEKRAAGPEEVDAFIRAGLSAMSVRDAAAAAADALGIPRKEAYDRAIILKGEE